MTAEHVASSHFASPDVQGLIDELSKVYRWLFVTDARRHVVWMSPDLCRLFGMADAQIGSDARRFIEKLPRPEQVFALRRDLRNRRVLTGAPLEVQGADGESVSLDLSVLKLDGSGQADALLIAIARPAGDATCARAALVDRILDDAPDAVLLVDSEGFVTAANQAAQDLVGSPRDEIVGRPAAAFFGGGASSLERIARLMRDRTSQECRVALRRADGRSQPVAVTARITGAGDAAGVVLGIRDASEREGREAELRRAIDELEHCITSLAHDLRSPLVALLGFSRLLRQEYGEALGETGLHFVDRIEGASRTIEGLVHDVLELSRAGQPGERSALVDPREVLLQLRAELKPRLEEAGIELSLPEPAPPLLCCDRTRLYQLFSNLIGNAIEHMGTPEHPRIEVRVEEEGDAHRIVVRDNGRGIDPAHRQRIFEPFQSFGSAPRARGAGMGLAIVKKIVEKRGGRIWVESELGNGTAFHVRLPRR